MLDDPSGATLRARSRGFKTNDSAYPLPNVISFINIGIITSRFAQLILPGTQWNCVREVKNRIQKESAIVAVLWASDQSCYIIGETI